jgi:RNA polymerase-associated protein
MPLLWRIDYYGIKLPSAQCKALLQYADRMFGRPAFRAALSPEERAMRAR